MKKIKITSFEALEKVPPPDDGDTPDFPDENYRRNYQYAVKLLKAFYDKQIETALKDVFSVYKNFITIEDLSRYIIYKIEEYTDLPDNIKAKLKKRFEKLYEETKTKTIGFKTGFSQPDIETIRLIDNLNDIYLGKFFQGDKKIRAEVLNWIKNYYFEEGNPIGKGQKGIKEFLNRFGIYLKDRSNHKIRQIIDTTVNFVKTSAQINAYAEANIKQFVWDAVNDRLTCPACRSMDGRIIKTEQAINQLQEIINKGLNARPIIISPIKDKTDNAPVKFPPLHPNCRCQTYAHFETKQIPYQVKSPPNAPQTPTQLELEQEYNNLTPEELHYKVKAHQGSSWYRMSNGNYDEEGKNLKKHFEKHKMKHIDIFMQYNIKTITDYLNLSKDIIENPNQIYIQRAPNGETDFLFVKGKFVVVSNDDGLFIKSLYILNKPIEERIEEKLKDGFATIQIY